MIDNPAYTPREMSAEVNDCPTCARLREWAEYVSRFDWRDGQEARKALEEHQREHNHETHR